MAEGIGDLPAGLNGDGSWATDTQDLTITPTTFTFVRRSDPGQPSTPPTPVDPAADSRQAGGSENLVDEPLSEAEDNNKTDTPTNRPPRLHPRFSRAFSLPQLGRLQNPHRSGQRPSFTSHPTDPAPVASQFYELSLELADMVQMAIQTLLQISPPQVLESTREQFSACALSVPTPSMSAMFTAMRNLNYFSANMSSLCQEPPDEMFGSGTPGLISHTNFDLGELLQSVGDVMSGAAAEVGVDLVLYHGDLSLKYACVRGLESGLTVALSHVLRQIMSVARAGDSIEVGLYIGFAPPLGHDITIPNDLVTTDAITSSPTSEDGPINCAIQIAHKFAQSNPCEGDSEPEVRTQPHFSGLILRRLLRQIGATLTHDLPSSTGARTCELSLSFDRAPAGAVEVSPFGTPNNGEPTLEELAAFAETLKGAKVALYASSKGSFAQHVTRYLADWGMDVSHMSTDGDAEADEPSGPPSPTTPSLDQPTVKVETVKTPGPQRPSFVFIDDNVDVLKERLNALRVEPPYQLTLNPKRPPLQHPDVRPYPLHSRRSTTQVPRLVSGSNMLPNPPMPTMPSASPNSPIIVHFTSLANFKVVKDILQSILSTFSSPIPEVMIVPKPAGPKRVLTQLHMAVTRPPVDPFFSPIATSPATPASSSSYLGANSYMGHPSRSPRPPSARSNSDRSNRSGTKEMLFERTALPPSPLAMPHTNSGGSEYFSSEDAAHLGAGAVQLGSTPSSGLLISSPPGQPAGIFFSPRAKTNSVAPTARKASVGPPMERDQGQLALPPSSRRGSNAGQRIPSGTSTTEQSQTFSSLHEAASGSGVAERSPRPPSRLASISIPASPRTEPVSEPASTSAAPTPPTRTDSAESAGKQQASPATSSPQISSPTAMFRRPMRRRTATPDIKVLDNTKKASDIGIVPPISVLIVEDNVVNQMQLAGFMRKKKLKYQVANNGLEAVEKWKTGNFDLILMDIQMPVMDGIDATKEIRRLEKLNAAEGFPPPSPSLTIPNSAGSGLNAASPYRSSVIIVAQTASSLNSDRVKALAAGCNDFLTKPVNHHWLNNKVTEWGSIKALQMWADMPPPGGQPNGTGLSLAKEVAERLHVPERGLSRRTGKSESKDKAMEPTVAHPSAADGPKVKSSGEDAKLPESPSLHEDTTDAEEDAPEATTGISPEPAPSADIPPVR